MSAKPIKIALIVEGEYLPAWQYLMLERLLAIPEVSLVTLVFYPALPQRWSLRFDRMLVEVLKWLDALLFRDPLDAQRFRTVLDLLDDVTVCMAGGRRYWEQVRGAQVDVVLDLTAGTLLPETLAWAKRGVWRYFYGKPGCHAWQGLGIAEYASAQDEFLSGIECFVAGYSGSECLYQAGNSVDQASLSRTVEPALWKMADFVPRCLSRRSSHLANAGQCESGTQTVSGNGDGTLGIPVFVRILNRYPAFLMRKLCQKLSGFEPQWVLLLGGQRRCLPDVLRPGYFEQLIPPADRFWADPILVERTDGTWLFFEELIYRQRKGHIACIKLHEDGQHSDVSIVLERPYHLSYPFVFEWQGHYYMIPETAENHTIELYRCTAFPHQWVFEKNLMENVDAFDATLHEHNRRWWMFVNIRKHPGESPHESLYLFHADNPLSSEWQPHPQNPVVASAVSARSAGPLMTEGGDMYRPSQNCAGWYGRGINLNLIRQWDMDYYYEEVVSHQMGVQGGEYIGMHTLALGKGLMVMDAIRPVYRNRFRQWMPRWCHA